MSNATAFAALAALAQTAKADMANAAHPPKPKKTVPINVFATPQRPKLQHSQDNPDVASMLTQMRDQTQHNNIECVLKQGFQTVAEKKGWTIA